MVTCFFSFPTGRNTQQKRWNTTPVNNKKPKEEQDYFCCAHRLLWVYLIGQETNKKHKRKELTWFKLQCFCKFDIRLSSWTKYYSLEVKRHEFKVYPNRAVLETILKSTCWTYQQLPPEQTRESLMYYRDGFLRSLLGNAKCALIWLWLPAAFFFLSSFGLLLHDRLSVNDLLVCPNQNNISLNAFVQLSWKSFRRSLKCICDQSVRNWSETSIRAEQTKTLKTSHRLQTHLYASQVFFLGLTDIKSWK